MKLLPDIDMNGHTISLQDPFVVDDYLVTDIEYFVRHDRWNIIFGCGNYKTEFDMNELARTARMALSHYTDSNITAVFYQDDFGHRTFDYRILCDLYLFYEWFYNRLNTNAYEPTNRLFNQERLDNRHGARYIPEYNAYKLVGYKKTDTGGNVEERLNIDDIERMLGSVRNSYHSNDLTTFYSESVLRNSINNRNEKTYIHQYNYKPEYIKHFMDHENKRTTLLLGAEIEVGGLDPFKDSVKKESVVKNCIQIMNGSESDKEDLIYSTHDGTVQIELDTMPCSLEYHQKKMNYKEMFKYLDEQGYKGHDCATAGLHIHANRDYLGKTKMQQDLVISKILYIIEKFNDEICVIGRRNTNYSKFVGDRCKEDTAINLFSKYKYEGKKAALNLQHPDTIEFRMFKSTLKYETFLLTLEFVKDIIDYAKSINIEEIEFIKWNDLMDTFSGELREYYLNRYKKIYKDKVLLERECLLKKKITAIKKQIKYNQIPQSIGSLHKELNKLMIELKKCSAELKKYNSIKKNKIKENDVGFTFINGRGMRNTIYLDNGSQLIYASSPLAF